ncbi:hypothetical protein ATO2_08215 [Roseovarius sp. 22II1-1F6A]|nr:hypothetical protein ATO2_08215 [Roseovarius sp. 22II1-1F6A]
MRAPEFEHALTEARAYPQLWRLLLGLGVIAFTYLAFLALLVGGAFAVLGPLAAPGYLMGLAQAATPGQTLLVLATFVGMFVGPMLAAAALHFRDPASLFGPWRDWWRGFRVALAVLVPIYALLVAFGAWLEPPQPNLPLARWVMLLPLALPLVLLQTGAEELLFRGYLQQQLAARFRARAIWMGLPTVIFALLHWTPEAGANLPLILLSALVFGLVAADLSEQTGSLGAAMGLHLGNNVFGLLVVSMGDQLTGLALFTEPGGMDEVGLPTLGMIVSIAVMALVWIITRRILTR